MKKKVVIISNCPAPYRVAFFLYLMNAYAEQYFFEIIYSAHSQANRRWSIDEKELKNTRFLKSKVLRIRRRYDDKYIHIPYNVYHELNVSMPDVIVCSEYSPTSILAMKWSGKHKKKFVSWTDGTLFSERNINLFQKLSRKYIIKNANAYIGSSTKSHEAQVAYGADEKKCFISSLTVDIERYLIESQNRIGTKLLFVGNLIQRKGLDLLFHALTFVDVEYQLTIVGMGDEKPVLEKQADNLLIKDKVCFAGELFGEELKSQYAQNDIFILPTREDCFGLVILEAMCAQMPIIASKYADGSYDLIRQDENGCIIDPYDAKAFGRCIQTLLSDKSKQLKMGQKSREYVEEYRFEKVAGGFVDAIESVMGEETWKD